MHGHIATMCMLCSDARLVWTFLASQNSTDAGVPAVQTLRNRSAVMPLHYVCALTVVGQNLLIPHGTWLTPNAGWLQHYGSLVYGTCVSRASPCKGLVHPACAWSEVCSRACG